MGANEKHAATYHGGEYLPTKCMPTTDDVRDVWVDRKVYHLPKSTRTVLVPTVQAEFDRWLETVRAEAKAEALNESATELNRLDSDVEMYDENLRATQVEWWLRDRANQYKENQ